MLTRQLILVLAAGLFVAACGPFSEGFVLEDGSVLNNGISAVNGAVEIGRDCRVNGEISSVNGGISIEGGSTVGGIENVNGRVRLTEDVTVDGDIENVNGQITLGPGTRIEGDVETVNGSIKADERTVIGGRVVSVNGAISLSGVQVAGVQSHNGSIQLDAGTEVNGPLTMKRSTGFNLEIGKPPKVVIGADVRVDGPLTFEREVQLYVHESATIGEVTGAEAVGFSGDEP
jgi:DUF4097 and DUF4098 domain-containing protein YvlB